jgi:sugar phosphate isomerase/epimerase
MKKLVLTLLACACASALHAGNFPEHLGLQLWSLNKDFRKDPVVAFDLAAGYGVTYVETASLWNYTPEKFLALLKERKLQAVSGHFQYDRLKKDLPGAVAEAKALGLSYAIVPWIPHQGDFTLAAAKVAADDFNTFGAAFKAAGIQFGYHPHGYEFKKFEGATETAFDVLLKETKPDLVCFQEDVYWIYHAGVDPAKLLLDHPTRWKLLHIKDMRKGTPTGLSTGHTEDTDKVVVGTGVINWVEVLRAAEKIGVKYYFVEDESPDPRTNITPSVAFLKQLKL